MTRALLPDVTSVMGRIAAIVMVVCLQMCPNAGFAANDMAAVSLLDGRLSARLPAPTKEMVVPHNIMAPPPSKEVRARYFTEVDGKRIMVMPTELFVRSSSPLEDHADFFARATQERLGAASLSRTWIESADGLKILQLSPKQPAQAGGAYLAGNGIVQMKDGTLIELPFFVDDAASAVDSKVVAAIGDSLHSLVAGPRRLRTGPRTKIGDCGVTVDLPADASAFAERGPDFTVCKIRLLVEPGSQPAQLLIYLGDHPERTTVPESAQSVNGRALARELTWHLWRPSEGAFRAEGRINDFRDSRTVAHLVITAGDALAREKLIRISATSTVE